MSREAELAVFEEELCGAWPGEVGQEAWLDEEGEEKLGQEEEEERLEEGGEEEERRLQFRQRKFLTKKWIHLCKKDKYSIITYKSYVTKHCTIKLSKNIQRSFYIKIFKKDVEVKIVTPINLIILLLKIVCFPSSFLFSSLKTSAVRNCWF